MWQDNPIVKMCNVRFPIIQAPMAGVATPRLVAAVSNAGGLGSLGAAYMSPNEIRESIREIRDLTEKPFAVNLFAPSENLPNHKSVAEAHQFLKRFREELGLPTTSPNFSALPEFSEQVEAVLLERPPVFSFTMGIPSLPLLQRLKEEEIFLIGTATTLEEGQLLEKSGVDAVVAQGLESGGHRGTFLDPANDPMLSLSRLAPLLVKSLSLPVIAAGGIMSGEGIAAAIAMGASAVQLGTAFIACPESGAARPYKEALLNSKGERTVVTDVLSGRPARMVYNDFIKQMQEHHAPIAAFPYQHLLTREIRTAASKMNRADLMALYAGQNYPQITNLPASEIIPLLVEQTIIAVQKLTDEIHPKRKKKHA